MKAKGFEELEVFQRAYRISLEIHKVSLQFPQVEQNYGLGDQIRRASKGICANIAEGFGKQNQSKAEFRRFVLMGIGSANEVRVWSRYCLDLNYINKEQWEHWRDEYEQIAKMLQGLGKALRD